MQTLTIIRKTFGEESMSHSRVFEWHARFRADRKKARQVKSKVKSMLIFDIKEMVQTEFVLVGQTVNSAY
jgi:hypothetical protein